ncbi:hypothetical protein CXF72_09745 [Psychromonas sp. MB-3u-54]|uniref:hypothetical protein n=1 Tax=Psychromonas sp. MB-3u-54 TaxID=2058319 RepID=UPI000C343156|nr:hypothetical protein [Psychromonas sp. MB-3u-54]PKH02791.1 hypothetical protein CXF72_09745 [Psychromonas sp. MB-3u-54]
MAADIILIRRLFSGKYYWNLLTEKRRTVRPHKNISAQNVGPVLSMITLPNISDDRKYPFSIITQTKVEIIFGCISALKCPQESWQYRFIKSNTEVFSPFLA